MKKILTYLILPLAIIGVGYWLYASINEPVEFNRQRASREKVAVQRLKDIRTLQVAYKSEFGKFTSSIDTLLDYYQNGQMTIIRQIGSMDDSLAFANKLVRMDSVKIQVKDSLLKRADFVPNELRVIPFSGGKPILMQAVIKTVSGVEVPLFEAAMPFNDLLMGLNHQLLVNLNAERKDINRYPGLKVGSVDAPNNNAGNWE